MMTMPAAAQEYWDEATKENCRFNGVTDKLIHRTGLDSPPLPFGKKNDDDYVRLSRFR